MTAYYAPDTRWEALGIADQTQFVERMLVKGQFHAGVPQDLVEAFETVEYLQALAYFHWPLLDEALNKMLRLVEVAVKLKARQLGFDIEMVNKHGKTKPTPLYALMEKIGKVPAYAQTRKSLDRFRKLRNQQMHPEGHAYMGIAANHLRNTRYFITLINGLFQPEAEVLAQEAAQQAVGDHLKAWEGRPLVMAHDGKRMLLQGFLALKVVRDHLFLVGLPVLQDPQKHLTEHIYPKPPGRRLSQFAYTAEAITGELPDGHRIEIFPTDHPANIETYERQLVAIQHVDPIDRHLYEHHMLQEAPWCIEDLVYGYWREVLSKETRE